MGKPHPQIKQPSLPEEAKNPFVTDFHEYRSAMGAQAMLEPNLLAISPGEAVSATLRVRNNGSVVDEFTFEPLGDAAAWTTVEPTVLRLLPDTEDQVQVTFQPPRSPHVHAGTSPFAVRVLSREDPEGSVVEEGTITVSAFSDVGAELIPRTARGRRKARQELAVDNRGNERLNAEIQGWDDDEQLDVVPGDPAVVAEPGAAAFTKLKIAPRKRFWRGPDRTHPYHVEVQPGGGAAPVAVQGSMLQQAILPPWFGKLLLILLAALAALAALWLLVLRPTIESTARTAVEKDNAAQEEKLDELTDAIDQDRTDTQDATEELTDSLAEVRAFLGLKPMPGEILPAREVGEPFDFRLSASATPDGEPATTEYTVEPKQRFELTDLVWQNPIGNEGLLSIQRGDDTLIELGLQNNRDLDHHFVTPPIFEAGETLRLTVTCTDVSDGANRCAAAAYFVGTLVTLEDQSEAQETSETEEQAQGQ